MLPKTNTSLQELKILKLEIKNFFNMDPITDMFNRIRNAQAVGHATVEIPFSELKNEIAKILEKENFIEKTEKVNFKGNVKSKKKNLKITLKYLDKISATIGEARFAVKVGSKQPAISGIKRISKSGQRIYKGVNEIRPVKSGYGFAIISTSKGLLTSKEAKKQKAGGEVIAEIW